VYSTEYALDNQLSLLFVIAQFSHVLIHNVTGSFCPAGNELDIALINFSRMKYNGKYSRDNVPYSSLLYCRHYGVNVTWMVESESIEPEIIIAG
jgi:hypothetical protein